MPLYTLASSKPLTPAVREAVATAVTDIHCQVTGAPAEFVNVVFMHGHSIRDGKRIGLIGNVRSGGNRTEDVLQLLREKLLAGVAGKSNMPVDKVSVRLLGVPSSWVMEGGQMMPEPGAEAEWLHAQT
jgi:hypothetical protein